MAALLSAKEVRELLDIDKSTVYRMASDGRLPAVKVGRQWRFPSDEIHALIQPASTNGHVPVADLDPTHAQAVIDLAAELLGVMMVVTDVDGNPLTSVSNPCPRFVELSSDPAAVATCAAEWRDLASDRDPGTYFKQGDLGFSCARSFVRTARGPVAMVLAGGIAPRGVNAADLYVLDEGDRRRVAAALPRIASILASQIPTDTTSESTRSKS